MAMQDTQDLETGNSTLERREAETAKCGGVKEENQP